MHTVRSPARIPALLIGLGYVFLLLASPLLGQQEDREGESLGPQEAVKSDTGAVSRLLAEAAAIRKTDPRKALLLAEEAEGIARKTGDSYGWSNALFSKCISHIYQGESSNALKFAIDAASIKEKIQDQNGLASIYTTMGTLYSKNGDGDRALEYQTRALKHYERMNDRRGLSTVKNNIGLLYMNTGAYQPALRFFMESITLK